MNAAFLSSPAATTGVRGRHSLLQSSLRTFQVEFKSTVYIFIYIYLRKVSLRGEVSLTGRPS